MNYLGHIYFSNDDMLLSQANLFGDHFKGTHFESLSPIILKGVKLHREIDFFTDNHPLVKNKLIPVLRKKLPKVAGIAVDLYFDHLLSIKWTEFHSLSFTDYLEKFYASIGALKNEFPEKFSDYLNLLKLKQWINHYPTYEGLRKLSFGVSNRLSFKNSLINAPLVFLEEKELIENCFFEFMRDAQNHFKEWHSFNDNEF